MPSKFEKSQTYASYFIMQELLLWSYIYIFDWKELLLNKNMKQIEKKKHKKDWDKKFNEKKKKRENKKEYKDKRK